MKTRLLLIAMLASLLLTSCGSNSSQAPVTSWATPSGTGHLRKSGTLWILNLEGNYTDMGRQYGALLRNELRTMYSRMNDVIHFDTPTATAIIGQLKGVMDTREKQLLQGMSLECGLTADELEAVNVSQFFIYGGGGCSAFAAFGDKSATNTTIAGRNFDNPRGPFSTILKGSAILVIYNPKDQFTGNGAHRDNSVAAMTHIGWLYGLTNLNSKGLYLEYNNATNSIPIDPHQVGKFMDGLHQNLYASFDSDTLEDVHTRLLSPVSVATMTQVADANRAWHYERSPFGFDHDPAISSVRLLDGHATGAHSYMNPASTSIITNHFFYDIWEGQNGKLYTDFERDNIDSGSRTFNRLKNLQSLASNVFNNSNKINVEMMKSIMTTPLRADNSGGPFIGWELENQDVTHFTTVTDVANRIMHINPNIDAILFAGTYLANWAVIDLNNEFR